MVNNCILLVLLLIYFERLKGFTTVSSTSFGRRTQGKLSVDLSDEEIVRYSRHLVLDDIGISGQKRLKESNVIVVGAGGLGSPCLMYLAAAGVGTIGIVDADTVSESNLQRQIIHSVKTLNELKTKSSLKALNAINPNIDILCYEEELTSENALEIFQKRSWDVVIDGSDNFPTKYLINDACEILNISFIYSAVLKFEGQLSVFNYPPGVGPTYRDFLPEAPDPESVPSCVEGGVLGVLPGVLGTLQATEAIKIILKKGDVCAGRVMIYDAMKMTFDQTNLQRIDKRPVIKHLIDYKGFCRSSNNNNDNNSNDNNNTQSTAHNIISPSECFERLLSGWTPYVLDVRLSTEHEIVALPFTDKVIPHRNIGKHHIPIEGDVLIYCKAGARSQKALNKLILLGIDPTRLWDLDGGIMNWRKQVDHQMPQY